jgi:putative nucleotidyltransferase with HDIG domain
MATNRFNLREAIDRLETLPAMPVIAQKLLALKLDTEEDEQQLLMLVAQDPLITAKLIGLASSPLLGSRKKVTAVRDAAMLLGLARVKSVATGIAMMSLMNQPKGRFDVQELWLHNLGIAFTMLPIARAMPFKLRPNADQAFLAGMLHDIGYLALAHLDVQCSDDLHTRLAIEPDRPALEIERELIDITHDELGAQLARHWNLPDDIVAVLRYHHTPDAPEAADGRPLVRMVNIAEKLLPSFGLHECVNSYIADEEWAELGIDPENAEEIAAQVAEQADQATLFINY